MDGQKYWVRTEQGRVWGPYTLATLQRMSGHFTERCEVSIDGTKFEPSNGFPELKELLAPARKVERQTVEPQGPRISEAMKKAFNLGEAAQAERPDPTPVPARTAKPAPAPAKPAPAPAPAEATLDLPASGELAETSVVRLYATAAQIGASGVLTIDLGNAHSLRIAMKRGAPEHLSSDDPNLSVLRLLLSRGSIKPEQAMAAEEQAKAGQDLFAVLFQLQLIAPSDAHKLLGEHGLYLLDRAVQTTSGKFTWQKDAPLPPGAFPLGQKWTLLSEAVRRMDPAPMRARFGKRLQRSVVRSGGAAIGKLDELALTAQESRVYASIDGTKTGEQLLQQHDAAIGVRLLYLLTEMGHLSFAESDDPADRPRPAPPPPKPPPAAEPPKRELPKVARPSAPPPQRPASPTPAPAPRPVAAMRPPPTFANGLEGETPEAQLQRLGGLLERLSKADHYETLGMERRSASPAEAKRNFFLLAKELHPDTVAQPGPLRELKEQLFARINEAAQVLQDDRKRKDYEAELDGKANNVDVQRIFAAEEHFQKAEVLIKAKKWGEGLEQVEKAIALNGEEAEFYAWRGYAKFFLAKDRKAAFDQAAGECRKAIKMIDRCLPAHLFLGHMAKVVGDVKLAQRCYEKVVELDPGHIEAQRELRLMAKRA